jgi:hypothetical protein
MTIIFHLGLYLPPSLCQVPCSSDKVLFIIRLNAPLRRRKRIVTCLAVKGPARHCKNWIYSQEGEGVITVVCAGQRVLNDLWMTRLSRCRVVWLLHHPLSLPPSTVSKLERRHTGRLRKRDNLLKGERMRDRTQIIQQQESLVIYKSFNTLWCRECTL